MDNKKNNKKVYAGYRWELMVLLCLAFFFHQADRAIFGVLLTPIKDSLQLSDQQMGWVGTILFATLALMMPFAGWLGDRFSKKWIITICILFWSAATAMTGLASGLLGLIFFRSIATAGGESFYAPSAYPMIAAWHKKTRSIALAFHQAALYIGVMCSGYLAGGLAVHFGWRGTFIAFGVCGILLGLIFVIRLKPMPQEDSAVEITKPGETSASGNSMKDISFPDTAAPSEADNSFKREISSQDNNPLSLDDSQEEAVQKTVATEEKPYSFWRAVWFIIQIPSFWLLSIGFSAIVFVNNAYVVWAPTLVHDKFTDISLTAAGGGAMFYHHLTAFAGIIFGGILTDLLVQKFVRARLWLQAFSILCGFPMILLMAQAPTLSKIWIMMALFGLFRGLYETNTHAAVFDVVPPKFRATAVALMTMIAFWIGSLSPLFLGYCRQNLKELGGLSYGFSILSYSYLIGAVALFITLFFTFKRDRYIEK